MAAATIDVVVETQTPYLGLDAASGSDDASGDLEANLRAPAVSLERDTQARDQQDQQEDAEEQKTPEEGDRTGATNSETRRGEGHPSLRERPTMTSQNRTDILILSLGFAAVISLVFITSDLLSRRRLKPLTVSIFVVTASYCVALIRLQRAMNATPRATAREPRVRRVLDKAAREAILVYFVFHDPDPATAKVATLPAQDDKDFYCKKKAKSGGRGDGEDTVEWLDTKAVFTSGASSPSPHQDAGQLPSPGAPSAFSSPRLGRAQAESEEGNASVGVDLGLILDGNGNGNGDADHGAIKCVGNNEGSSFTTASSTPTTTTTTTSVAARQPSSSGDTPPSAVRGPMEEAPLSEGESLANTIDSDTIRRHAVGDRGLARGSSGQWSTTGGCIVCFGDYAHRDKLCRLPCRHVYHAQCIDEWLDRANRPWCPLCKIDLLDLVRDDSNGLNANNTFENSDRQAPSDVSPNAMRDNVGLNAV